MSSIPDGDVLMFTMPQSEPFSVIHLNVEPMLFVKSADDKPWSTSLFHSIACSRLFVFKMYTIGAKVSRMMTGELCGKLLTMVGSTKKPGRSITFPPTSTLPPS